MVVSVMSGLRDSRNCTKVFVSFSGSCFWKNRADKRSTSSLSLPRNSSGTIFSYINRCPLDYLLSQLLSWHGCTETRIGGFRTGERPEWQHRVSVNQIIREVVTE